jgi:hypothetical protein
MLKHIDTLRFDSDLIQKEHQRFCLLAPCYKIFGILGIGKFLPQRKGFTRLQCSVAQQHRRQTTPAADSGVSDTRLIHALLAN